MLINFYKAEAITVDVFNQEVFEYDVLNEELRFSSDAYSFISNLDSASSGFGWDNIRCALIASGIFPLRESECYRRFIEDLVEACSKSRGEPLTYGSMVKVGIDTNILILRLFSSYVLDDLGDYISNIVIYVQGAVKAELKKLILEEYRVATGRGIISGFKNLFRRISSIQRLRSRLVRCGMPTLKARRAFIGLVELEELRGVMRVIDGIPTMLYGDRMIVEEFKKGRVNFVVTMDAHIAKMLRVDATPTYSYFIRQPSMDEVKQYVSRRIKNVELFKILKLLHCLVNYYWGNVKLMVAAKGRIIPPTYTLLPSKENPRMLTLVPQGEDESKDLKEMSKVVERLKVIKEFLEVKL